MKNLCTLIVIVLVTGLSSCHQSITSNSGIFEKNENNLEESLLGEWALESAGEGNDSKAYYEFYKDKKQEIKLRVLGEEIQLINFNGGDGNQFTFEYGNGANDKVVVVAQFKSYNKQTLMCLQEPSGEANTTSLIVLDKRASSEAQ
jgi:hypothetical protein